LSTDNPDVSISASETAADQESKPRFSARTVILLALAVVIVIDVIAAVAFPPFPPGEPGAPCPFPVCFINGTLEFPAPHVIWPADFEAPSGGLAIISTPSITSTILTLWIVSVVLLVAIFFLSRGGPGVPGRLQNFGEWAYESMEGFATSIGGLASKPYVPIFVSFFLLILFSNWVGLLPGVGRIEYLRAPTSDVNVTIGLAIVAFVMFEVEGFRRLGARKYLGKFFPIYEFKNGIGAGLIAMFVGLTEFLLDLVRPLTLSMRLFGNIYGGEVALGVITALTVVILPVLLLGLEFMLNLIQALIFSILALMYIVLAIEDHDHEEGHVAEEAMAELGGTPLPAESHASPAAPATNHASSTAHSGVPLGQTQSTSIASP
jgi:F-type H+-transporting ATPase subunit a